MPLIRCAHSPFGIILPLRLRCRIWQRLSGESTTCANEADTVGQQGLYGSYRLVR